MDDAGVRDGMDRAVVEGTDDEVLAVWIPSETLWVEVGRSEIDDVVLCGV